MLVSAMDFLNEIRTAQANWIAGSLTGEGVQAMSDARQLLAQAIADQNEKMISVYAETCLLLLEANRQQTASLMAMMTPGVHDKAAE